MTLPILRDFPDQFETDRLLIRCPQRGDGSALFEAVVESKAELIPWLPWAKAYYTVDDGEAWARRASANFILRHDLSFLIFSRADGRLLGGIGLHSIDWSVPSFEIGYWQRTANAGHGYMTEAVHGMTRFVREKLGAHRVTICCDTLNLRSKAVAERAGYTLESHMRNEGREENGDLRDLYVFAKTWPA